VEIAAISAGSAVQGTPLFLFFLRVVVVLFVFAVAAIDPVKQQFLPNVHLSARFFII
jgi:hypothetical protein